MRNQKNFEVKFFSFSPFLILPICSLILGWGINCFFAFAIVGLTNFSFFPALGLVVIAEILLMLLVAPFL
ncbi:MAG: hypothetical protein WCI93_03765 [bacterium]